MKISALIMLHIHVNQFNAIKVNMQDKIIHMEILHLIQKVEKKFKSKQN